jgi:hypothetical protein
MVNTLLTGKIPAQMLLHHQNMLSAIPFGVAVWVVWSWYTYIPTRRLNKPPMV